MKKMIFVLILLIFSINYAWYDEKSQNELLTYIKNKEYKKLVAFIKSKGEPNYTMGDQNITPLMFAIDNKDLLAVKILIKLKANMERKGLKEKVLPLEYSIAVGYEPIIKYLVDSGANVNGDYDRKPLLTALRLNKGRSARFLIKKGAKVTDCYNVCPIHLAARNGDTKTISAILKKGENINREYKQHIPLIDAIIEDKFEMVKWLIENGANYHQRIRLSNNEYVEIRNIIKNIKNAKMKTYLEELFSYKPCSESKKVVERNKQRKEIPRLFKLKKNKYGIINQNGKIIGRISAVHVGYLEDKIFYKSKKGKYGLYSSQGKLIMKAKYDNLSKVVDNKLFVQKDGRWALANIKGKLLTDFKYDQKLVFDGKIFFGKVGSKWKPIDKNGNELKFELPDNYDFYIPNNYEVYADGYYLLKHNKKYLYAIIDASGNIKIKDKEFTTNAGDGIIIYKEKGHKNPNISQINTNGDVLMPHWYRATKFLKENGFSVVTRELGYGAESKAFIDYSGKIVNNTWYDEVKPFNKNGRALVSKNKKWGIIDHTGKYISKIEYDDIDNTSLRDGSLIAVKKDGRWGYVDLEGNIVIDFLFNDAYSFNNNRAYVKIGNVYWIINEKGKKLFKIENNGSIYYKGIMYEAEKYFSGGFIVDAKRIVYSKKGKKMRYSGI